jgi:hypothetical protein
LSNESETEKRIERQADWRWEMMEDRELDVWREQWSTVAGPSSDMRRIQETISRQNRRFIISNLAALVALIVGLGFAVFQARGGSNTLERGEAAGFIVLMGLGAGYRLWLQRRTWRPETQSTRAFVELCHRRALVKLRLARVAMFVPAGWIFFCGVLVAIDWNAIAPDVKAHPAVCVGVLTGALLTIPASLFALTWYRRRKLFERTEVEKILKEMLSEIPGEMKD